MFKVSKKRAYAGTSRSTHESGVAVYVSTGSVLPAGCDTVVEIEQCAVDGDDVRFIAKVQFGQDVRVVGSDIAVDSVSWIVSLIKGRR